MYYSIVHEIGCATYRDESVVLLTVRLVVYRLQAFKYKIDSVTLQVRLRYGHPVTW